MWIINEQRQIVDRLINSSLPTVTKFPILLDKESYAQVYVSSQPNNRKTDKGKQNSELSKRESTRPKRTAAEIEILKRILSNQK